MFKRKRQQYQSTDLFSSKQQEDQSQYKVPKTPLLIETKTLFQISDSRKKSTYKNQRCQQLQDYFQQFNRSPIQSQMQERRKPDTTVYLKQIDDLANALSMQQKIVKSTKKQIEELENENKLLTQLNEQLVYDKKQLQNQVDNLRISINMIRQDQDTSYYQKQIKELQNVQDQRTEAQKYEIDVLKKEIQQLQSIKPQNMIDQTKKQTVQDLESLCLEMNKFIVCKICNKVMTEAVTVIPCAHSYCKNCKKGYQNQCYICGEEGKIEAIYLNQFMSSMCDLFRKNQELIKLF